MGRGLSDYRNQLKIQKEEEEKEKQSSSKTNGSTGGLSKFRLEKTIGLDTLESDLKSLGTTVKGIYEGWQTEETMKNTRSTIESMYNRLASYQDYQKQYGGADLSKLTNTYKTVLDGWDDLSSYYKKYKTADDYDKALKDIETAKATRKKMETHVDK